jgi:hypothetical protein
MESDIIPEGMTAHSTQVGGKHYKDMKIQPYEYIMANKLPYLEANVIKYVSRHRKKGKKEDIRKAIHNLELLLAKYDEYE